MLFKRISVGSIVILYILFAYNTLLGGNTEATQQEKQEYERDYKRVTDLDASLSQDGVRDMNAYEAFGDSIEQKWRDRNKEYHARLMLEICRPLSSDTFNENRRRELRRKYVLSALEEPDNIPLTLELELIGRVITFNFGPGAPKGEDFAQRRVKDAEVRLHGWKRLLEAIDPNWSPGEITYVVNVMPPAAVNHRRPGMDPKSIPDSALRAEYEEAIRLNNEKRDKYLEQHKYHDWLNRFPKSAENYIIRAYSNPPFAIGELRKMLDDQLPDQAARTRMSEAVEKNIEEYQK